MIQMQMPPRAAKPPMAYSPTRRHSKSPVGATGRDFEPIAQSPDHPMPAAPANIARSIGAAYAGSGASARGEP